MLARFYALVIKNTSPRPLFTHLQACHYCTSVASRTVFVLQRQRCTQLASGYLYHFESLMCRCTVLLAVMARHLTERVSPHHSFVSPGANQENHSSGRGCRAGEPGHSGRDWHRSRALSRESHQISCCGVARWRHHAHTNSPVRHSRVPICSPTTCTAVRANTEQQLNMLAVAHSESNALDVLPRTHVRAQTRTNTHTHARTHARGCLWRLPKRIQLLNC